MTQFVTEEKHAIYLLFLFFFKGIVGDISIANEGQR